MKLEVSVNDGPPMTLVSAEEGLEPSDIEWICNEIAPGLWWRVKYEMLREAVDLLKPR